MQTNLFKAATDVNETFSEGRPEDILNAPIEIIVAGAAHTGKSVVSAAIEKALQDIGFTNVVLLDSEETPEMRKLLVEKSMDARDNDPVAKRFLNKPITLRQANMLFTPPVE